MKVSKRQLKRIIKEEKKRLLTETMVEWDNYPDVGDAVFDFAEQLAGIIVATGAYNNWDPSRVDSIVMNHLFSAASDIAEELEAGQWIKS